jgi:CubicO group peptidase (beta-lactamase class C family)
MKYLKTNIILTLTLFVLSVSSALAAGNEGLAKRLEPIFEEFDRPDTPGMSVAVIDNGKLTFSRGYGSAQLEYNAPITTQTKFHVASVSKQFTAMAIMLLEADGKLSLDEEVQKYLPWVPHFNQPVTVRQLVNHTSGIRDQWELLIMAGWRFDDVITMNDIRTMMKRQTELNFDPQSDISYSNMGYSLLADIVAEVSGKSFLDFTQQRIFTPLGMKHSHFHLDHEEIVPGRSYSYQRDENGQLKKSVLSYANVGATSLFSTPEDLVLWLDNFRTHKLGSEQVFANMLKVPSLSNGESAILDGSGYAGGLEIGDYRGLKTIGHGGADAGFRSNIQWFPEHNIGIAVTTNLASGDPGGHLNKVADLVLKAYLSESAPAAEAAIAEDFIELDKSILERYEGVFQVKDLGLLTLSIKENELKSDIAGVGLVTLKSLSETRFLIEKLNAVINFEVDAPNHYDQVKISMGPRKFLGSRMAPLVLSSEAAKPYTGTYYSPELRTQWDLISKDGKLIIEHSRHGNITLLANPSIKPGEKPVEFLGDQWFASKLVFETDKSGLNSGFRVSGSRVQNVLFRKIETNTILN